MTRIDGEKLAPVPGHEGCYATRSGRIFVRRATNISARPSPTTGEMRYVVQIQRRRTGSKYLGSFSSRAEAEDAVRDHLVSLGEHPEFWERIGVPSGSGHLRVAVNGKDIYAHRLIAFAFLPNPDDLPFVRHLDDDPTNNHVDNLAWGTKSDNMRDRYRNLKAKLDRLAELEARYA